jgi:alkanesulfonate monooxygenase SsuD/methylene tetrahydromethanopterin reductase-like flavin-dependent oxidoreductase (luciferase family)
MQIGLKLPTTIAGATTEQILGFARVADEARLHSVWVVDRLVFPLVEALTALAAAAAVTSRVKLGTDVLIGPTHEPTLLAAQAASVDVLSGGRMVLGLGVGSREEDYTAAGRDFHTRGRRLDADIDLMRRIWAGESILEGFGPTGPRPVNGTIPLIFGGASERAMARGARVGDGFASVPRGVARHAQLFDQFRELWAKYERPGKPTLIAQAYFCVDDTVDRAREKIADYQQHYYGTRPRASGGVSGIEEHDLVGPAEVVAEGLVRYASLQPDVIILQPSSADLAQAETLAGPVAEMVRKSLAA